MNWIQMLSFPTLRHSIKKAWDLIRSSYKPLKLRIFLSDFWSVLGSIGFVAIPAALVGFIFLILEQGRDTLLLVIERMMGQDWYALGGLLFSLVIWSIFSELSVRYAIAVSDNSGINLSDDRVAWRKSVQKLLAAFFLLWPGTLVIIGFFWTLSTTDYNTGPAPYLYGALSILAVILVQAILCRLYFHKFGKGVSGSPKNTAFGQRSLPYIERTWLEKLYGIYNDYVFTLPKPTNFKGPYRSTLQNFTNLYVTNKTPNADLPQNITAMAKRRVVPSVFTLVNRDKLNETAGLPPVLYKWIYSIPITFYAVFHKRVRMMAIISFLIVAIIAIIPAHSSFFYAFGAPGLVCLAFGCYTGIYSGLLYLDKAVFPRLAISIRVILVLWVLGVSWFNNDHPVRTDGTEQIRHNVQNQFQNWFAGYKAQFKEVTGKNPNTYPVIFICAEGGAFRTGAYTALFLTQIEADLAKRKQQIDFRRSVFAMSGVSGGAVGLGFYNAVAFRSRNPVIGNRLVEKTKDFFLDDSLSPIIGKMCYGEFLNLFFWENIQLFDRSIALEQTWEKAYGKFTKDEDDNTYRTPFILADTGAVKPLFLINTTEVETGLQCWVTNAVPNGLLFQDQRDLLAKKIKNTPYSTAINFSSRFPFFSPAAMIRAKNGDRSHYLDGGYVENTGAASMLEMINLIKTTPEYQKITPVVINLQFSTDTTDISGIRFLNEFREIISGLLKTRTGRSSTAVALLKKEIDGSNGIWIEAPLTPKEKEIPMNWVLSNQSMNRIQTDIKSKLKPDGLLKKFFRPDIIYMPMRNRIIRKPIK